MTSMTIRLEQHTWQTPIHVGAIDEGYGVRLVVDIASNELVGDARTDEELELAETRLNAIKSGLHYLDDYEPLDPKTQQADAEKIVAELERLRRALASVKAEPNIWRELLPDEARAVAAALIHFAGEAEARR